MTVPANQKKWVIRDSKKGLEELVLEDGPVPSLGDHDILVRMHAAALNYRDLMITRVGLRISFVLTWQELTMCLLGRLSVLTEVSSRCRFGWCRRDHRGRFEGD